MIRDSEIRNNIARYCRASIQLAYESGLIDFNSSKGCCVGIGLWSTRGRRIALELVRNRRDGMQPFCCNRAIETDCSDAVIHDMQPRLPKNYRLDIDRVNSPHIVRERRFRCRRPYLLNDESLGRAVEQTVRRGEWAGAVRLKKFGREEPTRAVSMCPIDLGDDDICDAVGLVECKSLVTILTVAQAYFAGMLYCGDVPSWLTRAVYGY